VVVERPAGEDVLAERLGVDLDPAVVQVASGSWILHDYGGDVAGRRGNPTAGRCDATGSKDQSCHQIARSREPGAPDRPSNGQPGVD
jgi:hypothetical protein